jgi:hypothetical protein
MKLKKVTVQGSRINNQMMIDPFSYAVRFFSTQNAEP